MEQEQEKHKKPRRESSEPQTLDSVVRELEEYNKKHRTSISYGEFILSRFLGKI